MDDDIETSRARRMYLEDHAAAAAGGLALARHLAARYGDEPGFGPLHDIAHEIEEDRDHLETIREHLDARGGEWKASLAVVAERLRRLKHLDPWHDDEALQRLEELEQLIAGVEAKLRLCTALSAGRVTTPDDVGPDRLADRARSQLATLDELHRLAARRALDPGGPPNES